MNFLSYFNLLPAFKAGICDGLNPCNFATALILILYLSSVGKTQNRIFLFGLLFIVSSVAVQYGLANSFLDGVVTSQGVIGIFRAFYFLLTVVFVGIGIINIIDRWQYEKHSDVLRFKCKIPGFLKNRQKQEVKHKGKEFFIIIKCILMAFIVGAIATLCSSIYPQSEYIFIVYSYLMADGDAAFALMSFFQYGIASSLPLIIVWSAVFLVGLMREKIKAILYCKGITAALFLSVGIGLGFFLLK